ncbi:GTA protein [Sulfitobacter noctilucae]|uniref:head-tail connector protein n=1 Tax=Sulfitobacter noctilucae TaxID=1342302 RepID=UPI00046A6E9F|nr:head-tail connector protein [Sulfitobacter noctilucae]KIN60746.1 GTA protein [Sulfitobacter noctilucae]
MMLIEQTPILDAAVPVEAFKAHLRLGSGFGPDDTQDAVLNSFLRAAIAAVEARTGKVLLQREFSTTVTKWRNSEAFTLPAAPIVEVASVERVTRDGQRSLVSAAVWWLEKDNLTPMLRATGNSLPPVPMSGSVVITFAAGFASVWEDVPADLRQAVLMLAAHYYEYRHDTGLSKGCMPFGVSSLIERYKHIRIGTGASA